MLDRLRLGTRVITSNPTWPHIRKIAVSHYAARYVFTRGPARAVVDLAKADDPTVPERLTIHGSAAGAVSDTDLAAILAHVRADRAADGHLAPARVVEAAALAGVG